MAHRPLRRAQGMTEYIVLVGLIAIVLIFAVQNYSETLNVAIQGTTNGVDTVNNGMDSGPGGVAPPPPAPPSGPTGTLTAAGSSAPGGGGVPVLRDTNGRYWTENGSGGHDPYTGTVY